MSLNKQLPPSPSSTARATPTSSQVLPTEIRENFQEYTTPRFLAQEREIDELREENRALRREVYALRNQIKLSQNLAAQTRQDLGQRDELVSRLAHDIRRSLESYESRLTGLRDGNSRSRHPESTYQRLIAEIENDLLDLPELR